MEATGQFASNYKFQSINNESRLRLRLSLASFTGDRVEKIDDSSLKPSMLVEAGDIKYMSITSWG